MPENQHIEIAKFVFEAMTYLTKEYFGKKINAKDVLLIEPTVGTSAFDYDFFSKRKTVDMLNDTDFGFVGKQTDIFGMSKKTNPKIQNFTNLIVACPPLETAKGKYKIDERIRETYTKNNLNTNKNALYETHVRFLRWASDRVQTQGIVALVSDNVWLEASVFEGLRKSLLQEFQAIYFLNFKGNARTAGERRQKEGDNILGNRTKKGIGIYFVVKKQPLEKDNKNETSPIFYYEIPDYYNFEQKIDFIAQNPFSKISFEPLFPDEKHFWIQKKGNSFKNFIPLIAEKTRTGAEEKAIFRLFSDKISDENLHMVFSGLGHRKDFSCLVTKKTLESKWIEKAIYVPLYFSKQDEKKTNITDWALDQFLNFYQKGTYLPHIDIETKTAELKNLCKNFANLSAKANEIESLVLRKLSAKVRLEQDEIVPSLLKTGSLIEKLRHKIENLLPSAKDKKRLYEAVLRHCENFYAFIETEYNRADRLLNLAEYITAENIFYYVYAVLHNPNYRNEFAGNLRREYPHIPLYLDFLSWKEYGEKLVGLHTDFDSVVEYPLHFEAIETEKPIKLEKIRLKADKEKNEIELTNINKLQGIPSEAWGYRLGKESLLEQFLEQERLQKEENWVEKQNERVAKIRRRCTVSVATARIMQAMESL